MSSFYKYAFVFFCSAFGLCGLLILTSIYITNRELLSQTLSDLGAFGGFLSGVGTMVAAAAAAIGVDSWMKQLKYGKFLDIIWTAKVELRKVHMAEMDWYMAKYANRKNESNAEELTLKESVLELTFNGLLDSFHKLDQIVVKDQFLWANYGSFFKIKWVEIKWHMDANTHEEDLHNMKLVNLNSSFSDGYNDLMQQLEELEIQYSK